MNCLEAPELLGRFHDGELSQAETAAIEMHLRRCPDCADALGRIGELSRLTKKSPPRQVPDELWTRVAERLASSKRKAHRRRRWRAATLTAAAILVIAVVWLAHRKTLPELETASTDAGIDPSAYLDDVAALPAGILMSPQEASRHVGFRVVGDARLPDGYCLEECCLCNSGCCPLVACRYFRQGEGPLLLVQCSKGEPISYGNRPALETQVHGKTARIVQCEDCLAISWRSKGAVVNLIGPKDLSELVKLVAYVDQRLDEKQ